MLRLKRFPEPCFRSDEGEDSIRSHNTVRTDLFIFGLDANDFFSFPDEIVHTLLRDDENPFFRNEVSEPPVEFCPEDGVTGIGFSIKSVAIKFKGGRIRFTQ